MTRVQRLLFVFAICPLVAACGSGSSSGPVSGITSTAAAPTPTTATPTPTIAATTTIAGPNGLQLLGIGDSYMSQHDSSGNSFVDAYAELLRASRRDVGVAQLADGQNDTPRVLHSLENPAIVSVVAAADIIVLSVGGNDVDPFGIFPKGSCAPSQPWRDCLAVYAPQFEANTDKILTKIEELRDGKATAIRVLGADNPFVGWHEAPTPTFGAEFFAQVARAETNAVCEVAAKHHAVCIDILSVFSGPTGTDDPAKYLDADHSHPGDLGIATIADLLMKSGLAELG
jgi:lysophospholipase L1-like esterase